MQPRSEELEVAAGDECRCWTATRRSEGLQRWFSVLLGITGASTRSDLLIELTVLTETEGQQDVELGMKHSSWPADGAAASEPRTADRTKPNHCVPRR